jgi:small-conductance mechanosensitive channel
MSDFPGKILEYITNSPLLTTHIVETVGLILLLWLIRSFTLRVVYRNTDDKKLRFKWRKNVGYTTTAIGVLLVAQIWFSGVDSLATFLGLLSAGIAIALKDPVSDLAGWLFIIWRRPFDVGDRVQIGEVRGDIIDIRPFKFTLLEIGNWVAADQSTGRVIHIPNHLIFIEKLFNYTSDFQFIWNEIGVIITFESDWRKAKSLLLEIVKERTKDLISEAQTQIDQASKSYLIEYRYLTPIVYTDVQDSGIRLTIRHLTYPRRRRGTTEGIWEDILDAFEQHKDLDFAYPTIRYFNHITEGKMANND